MIERSWAARLRQTSDEKDIYFPYDLVLGQPYVLPTQTDSMHHNSFDTSRMFHPRIFTIAVPKINFYRINTIPNCSRFFLLFVSFVIIYLCALFYPFCHLLSLSPFSLGCRRLCLTVSLQSRIPSNTCLISLFLPPFPLRYRYSIFWACYAIFFSGGEGRRGMWREGGDGLVSEELKTYILSYAIPIYCERDEWVC